LLKGNKEIKMQKTVVKYSIISFLLLVYINRGLFITPYEIENHGNNELNSVIEWITQLVTGESNDIDEDGDLQTDCNSVTVNTGFCEDFAQHIDLLNLHSKYIGIIAYPKNENLYLKDFYTQIDHPPQWS
jgi:hypothetical protein